MVGRCLPRTMMARIRVSRSGSFGSVGRTMAARQTHRCPKNINSGTFSLGLASHRVTNLGSTSHACSDRPNTAHDLIPHGCQMRFVQQQPGSGLMRAISSAYPRST